MTERPTYLPMLEAIANAERQGHEYYQAWYDHATDPDLKETMRIVATRELEHSLAFTKRIDELGFECQPKEILDFTKQIGDRHVGLLRLGEAAGAGAHRPGRQGRSIPKNDPFGKSVQRTSPSTCRRARSSGATSPRSATPRGCSPRARPAMVAKYGSADAARTGPSTGSRVLEEKLDALCAAVEQCRRPSRRSLPPTARARPRRRPPPEPLAGARHGRSTS